MQELEAGPALEFQDQHRILEHAIQAFCISQRAPYGQSPPASKMVYYKTVLMRDIGSISALHLEVFQGSDLSDLISVLEMAREMLAHRNCVIRTVIALGELTKEQIIGNQSYSARAITWLEEVYRPSSKSARSIAATCC
jgi:hypothetical protein